MTRNHAELETLGDTALAELSRADDAEAFAELWRRHAVAGTTAARQFTAIADPQDLVSEAYLRILRAMQQGGGPHEAFRPYLYRTIRNIALDWRSRHPSISLDETADLIETEQSLEITVLENAVTARAFEELPERWQAVLWYLEVEGMSPSDAAPFLGLTPNATSALAARAHEGFKKAWLQAHVNDRSVPAECRWTTERMGSYVRHSLTRRTRARFDRHLDECDRCALLVQEIGDLGGQLASVLLPVTLGSAAGALLLGQLRDTAVGPVASALSAPPVAVALKGAAAAVLIASTALITPAAIEPATHPIVPTSDGGLPAASDPLPSGGDQPATVTVPPEAEDAPAEPEVAPTVEPVAAVLTPEAGPSAPPAAVPPPAAAPSSPLVNVSISLLSGTVALDAVVDINPTDGLVVNLLPGLSLFGR